MTNLKIIIILYFSFVTTVLAQAQEQKSQVLMSTLEGNYTGKVKNGLAHGKGVAKGQDEYTGKFKNGLPHGRGMYSWATGETFDGHWVNGKKHGEGMYTIQIDEKDSVLHGIWEDDKFKKVLLKNTHKVLMKYNVNNYTIKRTGEDLRVYMSISNQGSKQNYRNLNLTFSSGARFSNGEIFGIEYYDSPLTVRLTYQIPSPLNTGYLDVILEFEITKPGEYTVSTRH